MISGQVPHCHVRCTKERYRCVFGCAGHIKRARWKVGGRDAVRGIHKWPARPIIQCAPSQCPPSTVKHCLCPLIFDRSAAVPPVNRDCISALSPLVSLRLAHAVTQRRRTSCRSVYVAAPRSESGSMSTARRSSCSCCWGLRFCRV